MEIICSECGHREDEKAILCSQCGTKLLADDGQLTMPVNSRLLGGLATGRLEQPGQLPYLDSEDALVTLHVIRGGQMLPLPGRGEFIIGRVSEGQSILPDIDLEPFEGFESGVSRLHAQLHIGEDDFTIMDLGSSNGTHLNNQPLRPQEIHTLKHKDLIRLGQLNLQVLVNET